MSNFKFIPLLSAVEGRRNSSTGLFSSDLLPDLTTTSLAAGFRYQHAVEDMLLRNAEVQYVWRYAARQSHGSPNCGANRRHEHHQAVSDAVSGIRLNVSS
ncbi:hypothetical protein [Bradyrhizobium lablabi]|uniref:hypothetical protein n=1 Tax=Bradyrhizobium lablabi TaxID=722472 RepID=UPI001BA93E0F|nr:hypothetical protein [Bradyrhizobium lablabi]MBR0693792.1 hypothetical protein [Bradyrhizobium lablabi]